MSIPTNSLYKADSLAFLERIEPEQATLINIDPPLYLDTEQSKVKDSMEHLRFLSIVLQQSQRILSETGNLFFHADPYLKKCF